MSSHRKIPPTTQRWWHPNLRTLVVSVLTSLDGKCQGVDQDLSSMPFEDAFNDHNLELLRRAGTLVHGSRWFSENWHSWSAVAADDTANDRDHEIARIVTSTDSFVIGDSLVVTPDAPWRRIPESASNI